MPKNLFIFFIALLSSLACAEVAVRIWDPLKGKPSARLAEKYKKAKNSLGLRGKTEYPLDYDGYRILTIGDSFTYALKLKESGSWPRYLEGMLQEKYPEKKIQVLNGGRPGTNTQHQLQLFNKSFYKYKPDLVILGFLLNDCTRLCSNCGPVQLKNKLRKIKQDPGLLGEFSYLYRMLRLGLVKRRLTQETVAMYKLPYEQELPPYQQCIDALSEFKKLSEAQGFKFVVVIYPMLFGLKNSHYPFAEEHAKILAHLKNIYVPGYDLLDIFKGQEDSDLWVLPTDSHPNRRANKMAAQRLVEIVKEQWIN